MPERLRSWDTYIIGGGFASVVASWTLAVIVFAPPRYILPILSTVTFGAFLSEVVRRRARREVDPVLLREHTERVRQWVQSQRIYLQTWNARERLDGHIDMTAPMATVVADHFKDVCSLVEEWNKTAIRHVQAWNGLATHSAAAAAALGFSTTGGPSVIFWCAIDYARGLPPAAENLDFVWLQDALLDRNSQRSIRLDRPHSDAERLALPGQLKERCIETQRWDETRALGSTERELATLGQRLEEWFQRIEVLPELPGTCQFHPTAR